MVKEIKAEIVKLKADREEIHKAYRKDFFNPNKAAELRQQEIAQKIFLFTLSADIKKL